jgi:hypothetical protein
MSDLPVQLPEDGRAQKPALPVNPLCVTCMDTEAFTAMVASAEKSFANRVREAEAQQKGIHGAR